MFFWPDSMYACFSKLQRKNKCMCWIVLLYSLHFLAFFLFTVSSCTLFFLLVSTGGQWAVYTPLTETCFGWYSVLFFAFICKSCAFHPFYVTLLIPGWQILQETSGDNKQSTLPEHKLRFVWKQYIYRPFADIQPQPQQQMAEIALTDIRLLFFFPFIIYVQGVFRSQKNKVQ